MTHDELLAEIDRLEERYTDYPTYLAFRAVVDALLAVVELHKPFLYPENDKIYCEECGFPSYPCDTIQAIEKEL